MVAAETRLNVAAPSHGLAPTTQWKNNGCKPSTLAKCSRFRTFNSVDQTSILELKTRDTLHGGLADLWFFDDGDIVCHPTLVPPCLQEFYAANEKIGAERIQKTEFVLLFVGPGCTPA